MEDLANDNQTKTSPTESLSQLPSPNTSLVCGIISIVAASTIVPGFVLGLISLVSASSYKKAGGNPSDVRAGKTCGIIGLVLSVVSCIFVAMIMIEIFFPSSYENSVPSYTVASVYESAQKAADPFLDSLASKDPDLVEEGGWIIESSFNRIITSYGIPIVFKDCGIDSRELAISQLSEFSYSYLNAYEYNNEMHVDYSAQNRNPNYVGNEFKRRLSEIAEALNSGSIEKEEVATLVAAALKESFEVTWTSKEQFIVDLQWQDGEWTLTGSEQGQIMNYVFSLTTEAENHGLSDSEYEQAKQFGLL